LKRIYGSWGDATSNRPLLSALATLAFIANGEPPASTQYGSVTKNALISLTKPLEDNTKNALWNPMSESATVWCLAEAYGMTQHPGLRDSLLKLLQHWEAGHCLSFDIPAVESVRLSRAETNTSQNVRQCQSVCATNGWWTSASFCGATNEKIALFSPREERIYTTSLILIAQPPSRYLPSFQFQLDEDIPSNTNLDVHVIIR